MITTMPISFFFKLLIVIFSKNINKTLNVKVDSSSAPLATIWSVDFNNGCASNCLATTYGGWTVIENDGGMTGGAPNDWFVSCAEEGITPPGCGSSCIGDQSLHIGANPGAGGDQGASYNETGVTNATFRTVVSPTISTVGFSTITLVFDFIAFGSSACTDDRAQLRLSTDNGATWPVGFQYCLTSVCCGACNGYSQGQWTTYTLALPAAFDNNPNVRIGFNWRNNGNGSGTDPSVAIDDIRLTDASTCIPNPGNTISTSNPICPEENITLSLQNPTSGGTVTYQWQSSPNNITYADISMATSDTYAVNLDTSTYFKCKVTCDGNTVASNPLQVNVYNYTTVASGDLTNPAVWAGGCVPPNPVPPGTFVTINHPINNMGTLTNNGTITSTIPFHNYGIYQGKGIFMGVFINETGGIVKPGN